MHYILLSLEVITWFGHCIKSLSGDWLEKPLPGSLIWFIVLFKNYLFGWFYEIAPIKWSLNTTLRALTSDLYSIESVIMWYNSNSSFCLQLSIYTIYNLWWREQWTFPEVLARLIGQIRSLVAGSLHLPRSPTNILALNTENILSYRKNF